MCIAVIGKILSVSGTSAEADFNGIKRTVDITLKPSVKKGDYVLVHAGFAMEILDKKDALSRLKLLKETGFQ